MSTVRAAALELEVPRAQETESPKPRSSAPATSGHPKRRNKGRRDPELVFILARQSVLRWEFAASRMRRPTNPSESTALDLEIALGVDQLRAVRAQLQPLTRSRNLAVRFEAEEELLRVNSVAQMVEERQQQNLEPAPSSGRTALEVQKLLVMKLKAKLRR